MFKIHKFLLVLFSVFIFSAVVKADPIKIVSGTVNKSQITLQGENPTKISLTVYDGGPIITDTEPRFQFASGSSASPIVDGFGGYGRGSSFSFRGNATINGINFASNNSYFGGTFGFGSEIIFTPTQAIQLPTISSSNFSTFSVQVPFTMQGYLNGVSCQNGIQGPGTCDKISGIDIYGTGNAKFTFYTLQRGTNSVWALSNYEYTFSTPEPTPEPTTILLLGTGLAGIWGIAKRRRKTKDGN